MQAPNRLYKSEVRASVLRVKTPCEQGLHVRATSRATPSFCDGEGEAQSPWNVDPLRSTTLRGIRSARSALGQRSFRSFLCPTPKVTPGSSLGGVREARWPLSHRWTDTSFTLPDAAHNSRNQGHVVSLSELVEPPLGVRPTLPAARGSSQLAAIAEFLVTDAERRNRRVTFLLHIISDVTRVRHAQGTTLSILRAFIACAAAVQTAVLVLFGPSCLLAPVCLGHYRPLHRRSASDKCSVRCRPMKQRDKIYRNF